MKRRRPRPRKIITRVIVFLLLGAIVNVAVAWGCIYGSNPGGRARDATVEEKQWLSKLGWVPQALPQAMEIRVEVVTRDVSSGAVWLEYREVPRERRDANGDIIGREEIIGLTFWNRCVAYQLRAGFPCLAVEGGNTVAFAGSNAPRMFIPVQADRAIQLKRVHEFLPYGPLWPGFAINTIFYAAILWVLFFAPGSVRRAFRRRRGVCPACAYPVGTSPVCTECGEPFVQKRVEIT